MNRNAIQKEFSAVLILSGFSLSQISQETKVPQATIHKLMQANQYEGNIKKRSEAYLNILNYIKDHCLSDEKLKPRWILLQKAVIQIRDDKDKGFSK